MTTGGERSDGERGGTWRLFLGVPFPDPCRATLIEWLQGMAVPGRLEAPERWHLTIRFLGSTSDEMRVRLIDQLSRTVLGEEFELALDGVGAFPRPARASVLWVGLRKGSEEITRLAARVDEALEQIAVPPRDQPFRPHLTLSRIRPAADVRALIAAAGTAGVTMPVDRLVLFRSHLGKGPARYEQLHSFPLMRT